jgi:NADH:ubiquinone oxidoreductase subunit 6 (subunit J)
MFMTPMQFVFIAVSAVTLVAALMVVTARSLVHSALWLVLTLFGVGVVYALLNAGFFAVAQVLIYIGAIAILFIFAVMLTRKVMQDTGPQENSNWWLAALIAAGMFVGLFFLLNSWGGFSTPLPVLANEGATLAELGKALVGPYLLPFELASVLLVAAMIGAIYVSYSKK